MCLRTDSNSTYDPNKGSNFNMGTCNKTDVGTYTLTITSCPSSSLMLTGHCVSWGASADGNSNNDRAMNLVITQTSTSGGNSTAGAAATIQFKVQTDADSEIYNNFLYAHFVVYAA